RDVAERLRHLDAVDGQHLVVHPDPREGMARMRALALRNLVLVVRENEIEPAAMDVEGLAELGLAHRRAFDMPARPAAAPRAVPTGLVGGGGLPQHKIAGIALVGRDLDPRASDHLVAAAARELAVARPGGDREQ